MEVTTDRTSAEEAREAKCLDKRKVPAAKAEAREGITITRARTIRLLQVLRPLRVQRASELRRKGNMASTER